MIKEGLSAVVDLGAHRYLLILPMQFKTKMELLVSKVGEVVNDKEVVECNEEQKKEL